MVMARTVGILVFDDVEVLDFAGPFEVFNVASEVGQPTPFSVCTIGVSAGSGETGDTIRARGGLSIRPAWTVESAPKLDIAIIPGGNGTRRLLAEDRVLGWIRRQVDSAELVVSVCTGALLLAAAGVLDGRTAVTHHTAVDELHSLSPTTEIDLSRRYVRTADNLYTAGGISAGIDLSLHLVRELCSAATYEAVVEEMEYHWHQPQR